MSKHLRILRDRGLVTETHPAHDTRVRIYSLRSAPMADLRAWLDTAARAWTEQLAAFAEHLERTPDPGLARPCGDPGERHAGAGVRRVHRGDRPVVAAQRPVPVHARAERRSLRSSRARTAA